VLGFRVVNGPSQPYLADMTAHYQSIVFSDAVKAAQEANGSRKAYSRQEGSAEGPDRLSENEAAFIATRDSFYMATVGAGGWPYMQHRGGPAGFVKIIDPGTLAIADYRGNRQYVTVGNTAGDNRVALFFMDYPRRARLKLLARTRIADLAAEPALAAAVIDPGYKAAVERALVFSVEAFDWNCPQHITPRYTLEDLTPALDTLKARIAALEAELAAAKG
jgi:uncharacterized protein